VQSTRITAARDAGRRLILVAVVAFAATRPLGGQEFQPRVYLLNVPLAALEGPWSGSGITHLSRARVFVRPSMGPVTLDVAYEHTLQFRVAGAPAAVVPLGTSSAGGEWLPLQGTLVDGDRVRWQHRLDRAAIRVGVGGFETTVGRQTISWATRLVLTPADPFQPFDPADPFRTYRGGVDAVRVRFFPGPFSNVEAVARIAGGRAATVAGRWSSDWGAFGVSAWGGVVHDRVAGSVGLTVTAGGAVFRGEGSVRATAGDPIWRAAVGVDRGFELAGRTLYVAVEYQHDGFGARGPEEFASVIGSEAGQRGELQVLGQDAAALTVTYAAHPLVTVDLLAVANLRDPSVLAAPGATVSVGNETSLRLGVFYGAGRHRWSGAGVPVPGSEYGPVPLVGYAALEMFF
jgi:hypothetical protein